ncbi:hypothetical protein [Streptomyces malaysiensis]|uniref:Uncharacterized protein n=1 Tax=Streptomyces malaysiensis subsp. samsunensis TaxID=459658 RepID=A0A9X2RTB0_STRMQ|nr:hypothetical protein [Streptomyces samsunensis]MCQ8829528.1 hypothetical protein [Streptomyces samsunensis]
MRDHSDAEYEPDEPDMDEEEPVGESGDPDVLLDVPQLQVEEINLKVENLQARVSLQAEVLDLLKLGVGADVSLGHVELDIKGVEARALLKVRLDNVAAIVGRVLSTIDRNPQILEQVTSGLGSATERLGSGAEQAVGELGEGAGEAVQDVGKGAGKAVEEVGEGAGGAVEDAGEAAGKVAEEVGEGAGKATEEAGGTATETVRSAGRTAKRSTGKVSGKVSDKASGHVSGATGRTMKEPASESKGGSEPGRALRKRKATTRGRERERPP